MVHLGPFKVQKVRKLARHGTIYSYRHGCRCVSCKKAKSILNAREKGKYRRSSKPLKTPLTEGKESQRLHEQITREKPAGGPRCTCFTVTPCIAHGFAPPATQDPSQPRPRVQCPVCHEWGPNIAPPGEAPRPHRVNSDVSYCW